MPGIATRTRLGNINVSGKRKHIGAIRRNTVRTKESGAQGLERAREQIEKAFDALDSGKADHDTVKERIAGAMAMAQVRRIQLMEEAQKLRLKALIAN
jgi:DNA-binding PadR family transcriptional regulator